MWQDCGSVKPQKIWKKVFDLSFLFLDDTAPSVGGFSAELESLSTYLCAAQQQEPHGFKMNLRQGLTPPQTPGDHMNPYGTGNHRLLFVHTVF